MLDAEAAKSTGALPSLPATAGQRTGTTGTSRASFISGTHAAEPARRLGPKARQLLARRRAHEPSPRVPGCNSDTRFATWDRHLLFQLIPTDRGLFIERTQQRSPDARLIQCLILSSLEALQAWTNAEPIRYEDPALHQRLCRKSLELLRGRGG
jgi:hypothetical protein